MIRFLKSNRNIIFFINFIILYFFQNTNGNVIQWISHFRVEPIYNVNILKLLNEIETMADFNPILKVVKADRFSIEDIKYLTGKCYDSAICLKNKSICIDKYRKKVEAMQCMNAAIIKSQVKSANILFSDDSFTEIESDKFIKNIEILLATMISLLYTLKVPAHRWLWTSYSLVMTRKYQNIYQRLIKLNEFKIDNYFLEDLTQHLRLCKLYKYLPKNYDIESSIKIDEILIQYQLLLSYRLFSDSWVSLNLLDMSFFDSKLAVDFLVPNIDESLYFIDIGVNWNNAISLLRIERNKTINQPYDSVNYYHVLIRVVKVNVLYLVLKHLIILEKSIYYYSVTNPTIQKFYSLLRQPLKNFIKKYGLIDTVFCNVIEIFHIEINDSRFNDKFYNQLKEINEDLKKIIMEDFLELGVDTFQARASLMFTNMSVVKKNTDLNQNQYKKHINQLINYTFELNSHFPFFHIITFYTERNFKLNQTFHMWKIL
ncbi:uncharacterized protein LOC126900013 [Daktulosphaira vitifoliae]|uniref:uncharacterized protein LOC126900013 n=1 Tax=Daktulosphaira vitifoliae TaxID=58002 RepID=UPI0021A9FB75|nr:uncharacterized protein LOC126900013 [Daktulosphaira vitifoliae]